MKNRLPDLGQSSQRFNLRRGTRKDTRGIPSDSLNEPESGNMTRSHTFQQLNAPYMHRDFGETNVLFKSPNANQGNETIESLKSQIVYMQRQLKVQQNSQSFIKKITPQQACSQCERLKLQFEECQTLLKNQRSITIDQKQEIAQLQQVLKSLQMKIQNLTRVENNIVQTPMTIDIEELERVKRIENYYLVEINEVSALHLCLKSDMVIYERNLKEYASQIQHAKQMLKAKSEQIVELEKSNTMLNTQMANVLNNAAKESQMNDQLQLEIASLEKRLLDATIHNEQLQKNKEATVLPLEIHTLKKTIDKNLEQVDNMKLIRLEAQVKLLEREKSQLQQQIHQQDNKIQSQARNKNIENYLIKIEAMEMELYLSLRCTKCRDLLKDSLTCIPCGHTYCLKCHRGYKLSCDVCDSQSNTEALYRNIQFDELIKVYHLIQNTKGFIKNCLLSM